MDSHSSIINLMGQNDQDNNWKSFLLRNCLYFYIINNMEFFNSFSICNNMLTGQNSFPSFGQQDPLLQNLFLTSSSSMDETLITLIQNINDSLIRLFNYYQELFQQNPNLLNQIFSFTNLLPEQISQNMPNVSILIL